MKTSYDIIQRPVITENSMDGVAELTYTFEVARDSNKIEIKQAVEELFDVKVRKVNTINQVGKLKRQGVHIGRRAAKKKAIVSLYEDSKPIEFFEGMV